MERLGLDFVSPMECEDSKLSKAEILRGLITEKLTTAAREIFAVVERTVTGYEDEVSGLKQEVDQQRRQLEAVLQPQVSLCRIEPTKRRVELKRINESVDKGFVSPWHFTNPDVDNDNLQHDIRKALPELHEETARTLSEHLRDIIGVRTKQDLLFVEPDDFGSFLTPIQNRRLLQAFKKGEVVNSNSSNHSVDPLTNPLPAVSLEDYPPASLHPAQATVELATTQPLKAKATWIRNFQIPWEKMPVGLSQAMERGVMAPPEDRRKMIRIIVEAMRAHCLNPNLAACTQVARLIVTQCPATFADKTADGEQLGCGYYSILKQLKTRVEYVNRDDVFSRIRQPRKRHCSGNGPHDVAIKRGRSELDRYGCVNWQPIALPEGETVESLEAKRKTMSAVFRSAGPQAIELVDVDEYMTLTYICQRQMLNSWPAPHICEIKEEWPFLFTKRGLCSHFRSLTGVEVDTRIKEALSTKGRKIWNYCQSRRLKQPEEIGDLLSESDSRELSNDQMSIAVILQLMKCFKENEDSIFILADALSTKESVETEMTLPTMPRVIMLGNKFMSATRWMVSMEGKIFYEADQFHDFPSVLAVFFGSYYVFNLEYQESASTTLEMIQRFFVRINPDVGTKCTAKIDEHGLVSVREFEEGTSGGQLTMEQEWQRQQTHVEDTDGSCKVSEHSEEQESEEEEEVPLASVEEPAQSSSVEQEGRRDSDCQMPNKRGWSLKTKFRTWNTLNLRVCLLKNTQTSVLKRGVLNSQIKQMKCPRRMKEAEFLNQLRSTFPRLTGQFDTFTSDASRKLTPLKLKTLTPLEICKSIKSTGKGRSALYIRVKAADKKKVSEFQSLQKKQEAINDSLPTPTITSSDSRQHTSSITDGKEDTRDSNMSNEEMDSDSIQRRMRNQRSALYIRVKAADKKKVSESEFQPLQKKQEAINDSLPTPTTSSITDGKEETRDSNMSNEESDSDSDSEEDDESLSTNRKMQRLLRLRVCLIKDTKTNTLKKGVLKSPMKKVTFHRGMKEAEFLDCLRSTFPQLTGQFDALTTDASRKLTPLKLKTLTPKEICKSIKSMGKGRSALYIRVKAADENQTSDKEFHPAIADSLSTSVATNDENQQHRSTCNRPAERVEGEKTDAVPGNSRNQQLETESDDDGEDLPVLAEEDASDSSMSGDYSDINWKPENGDDSSSSTLKMKKQKLLQLRVCFLKDTQTAVLTKTACKYPVQKLRFPRGLQEKEFLNLLRSTFPEIPEGNQPFDAFLTDKLRKLQPLKVKTLTPEEISKSIKSTGKGGSALYIRLKRNNEATSDIPSISTKTNSENLPHASSSKSPVEKLKDDEGKHQQMETGEVEEGEDCGISDSDKVRALSSADCVSENEDNGGDEEVEEGESDADWIPDKNDEGQQGESDPELKSLKVKRKLGIKHSGVNTKRRKTIKSSQSTEAKAIVSCKVCGSLCGSRNILIKHSWSHVDSPKRLCGVCGNHSESSEELRSHLESHLKTHTCNICGRFFICAVALKRHVKLHSGERPFKCDMCHKAYVSKSSLLAHRWKHVEDKPHKCDICHRSFGEKQQLMVHNMIHTGEKPYCCLVCSKSFGNLRSLSLHKLSHSREKHYSCQVCEKPFVSVQALREHQKIHTAREKSYLCDVCCKTFYTKSELNVHLKTHSNEKILCTECGKGLSTLSALKRHMIIHSGERPYSCSECGRAFNSRSTLNFHKRTHSGEKRFVCSICGKACPRLEHLKVHMRTHNGERPYQCTVCHKAFTQSHCLKKHMKSHQGEEQSAVDGLKS
ncbi:hypothetical protein Q5P01_002933 [Channa striata]|uniref:C2H2-type domain-containing protein n=1 Tax=Channa striata TaxID=64152 RepID=A0AA88NRZ3_CHASR|nr:hypothetical protein Q5P01_002933 [Channa striata]